MNPSTHPSGSPGRAAEPRSPFAHGSEAELSRILDFYGVPWEYEPHVFPILWNTDGDVLESFAPDFYLPDLDLYLELTTLKQRLVRKKNRKLRRLRELYPGLNIKLFYGKDFRALMLKYGRLALADELSGTIGQVRPEAEVGAATGTPETQPTAHSTGDAADQPPRRQVRVEPRAGSRRTADTTTRPAAAAAQPAKARAQASDR